ncbi:hypothetical protein [Pseudomonas sp. VI4.1]|uniref:hypothetical protein n=1 Tax=Pseudomonas sp. VI4.1 TaxID=1941346 RepID=UPI0015B4E901|nr:hypothetical protein [Pseudomonas sp. VI4.1]
MKIDFDANEDSQAQAILLVNALSQWIEEQPQQPPRPGKAQFCYRPDGTLDSIHAELDGAE